MDEQQTFIPTIRSVMQQSEQINKKRSRYDTFQDDDDDDDETDKNVTEVVTITANGSTATADSVEEATTLNTAFYDSKSVQSDTINCKKHKGQDDSNDDVKYTKQLATTTPSSSSLLSSKQEPVKTKKVFSIFNTMMQKSKIPKPLPSKVITATTTNRKPQIYCDLDGVLVDFNYGIQQLENIYHRSKNPNKSKTFNMWAAIQRTNAFYRTLPWTTDGKVLWDTIQHLQPHILTGVPSGSPQYTTSAAQDKYYWCQRELQFHDLTMNHDVPITTTPSTIKSIPSVSNDIATTPSPSTTATTSSSSSSSSSSVSSSTSTVQRTTVMNSNDTKKKWIWRNMAAPKRAHQRVNVSDAGACTATTSSSSNVYVPTVITCWSINKHYECRNKGDVLIDDRPHHYELQNKWKKAGGIFIHHTCTQSTIEQLQKHGLI